MLGLPSADVLAVVATGGGTLLELRVSEIRGAGIAEATYFVTRVGSAPQAE
jgi:hypothetical protein